MSHSEMLRSMICKQNVTGAYTIFTRLVKTMNIALCKPHMFYSEMEFQGKWYSDKSVLHILDAMCWECGIFFEVCFDIDANNEYTCKDNSITYTDRKRKLKNILRACKIMNIIGKKKFKYSSRFVVYTEKS